MLGRIATCLIAAVSLLVSAAPVHAASAAAAAAQLKSYLPAPGALAAEYVAIERDPNFDVHTKRIRAALEANRDWFNHYRAQHAGKEMPWHPNFGVPEADYVRYKAPVNHFREVARKRIRLERLGSGSKLTLRLHGEGLLLEEVQIDTDTPAAATSRGSLAFREVVNLERASLPPAVHQGISFNTPNALVLKEKFRESILLGRLKGTSTGIVHYGLNTSGRIEMFYVVYPLGN